MTHDEITQTLKARRADLRMTQDELAQACGFAHKSSIHKLEQGKLEWKLRDAVKAARAMGLKITIE